MQNVWIFLWFSTGLSASPFSRDTHDLNTSRDAWRPHAVFGHRPTRVGYVSSSAGKRARAPRTARCGRTCAPSGGSWGCLRPTGTRSTRRSPGSSTVTGCKPYCTCRTSRYIPSGRRPITFSRVKQEADRHIQSSQTGSLICPSECHECGIGELNFRFAGPAKELKRQIGRDSDNDDTSRA